jgi:DNA invertase Pin-like site-specific DNA recombinase
MGVWKIYVRRSWKEATAADLSDDQQEASARALLPPGATVEVISDSGGHNSGRTEARDGYRELIAAVRAGKVDGIAVYDLSRLARNARLMLNLHAELERHQVALVVATMPNTKFDTAIGRYMFGQLCLAAQLQADLDSERMSAMLHRTFEDGRHRGHDPYGYRSERDEFGRVVHPRQLVVVPEEADVVRQIWRELQHRSFDDLTRLLNAQGILHRSGHVWTRDAVKDIWRRGRVYLGYVVEKRGLDERPGHHEPILDEETYRATLAGVRARTRTGKKPGRFRLYLLRGAIYCRCGARMRGEARVQRGNERRYYRCPRAGQQVVQLVDGQPATCHERLVPADAAEKIVLNAISRAVLPADVIEAARDELQRRLQVPHDSLTGRQRARLQQRLEQLRKQHEWSDITDEDYRAKRAETLEELSLLPDSDKLVAFDRNRKIMTSMAANVSASTPQQQAELVQMLVGEVVASGGKVSERDVTWTPPARPFFAEVAAASWLECPQGALRTRPLSDDADLAWWVA